MADEPTDGTEPTQEPVADAAQVETAPADLAPAAAADAGADAGTAPADPDTLEALWERYPSLREQAEQSQAEKLREREVAGANRERERLRREAGKDTNVRNRTEQLHNRWDEMTPEERQRDVAFTYSLAEANAAYELATSLPEATLRNYTVPIEAREAALEARERGDWDGYVTGIVNGAVTAEVAKLREGDEAKNTADVNRRLAAEMKVRGLEKAPVREGAPTRPAGSGIGAGMSLDDIDKEPMSAWMARPAEERSRLIATAEQMARR